MTDTFKRPRRFGPVVNHKRIDVREYDAILRRLRQLGKSDESVRIIADEFNRGVTTIARLRGRV